MEQLLEIRSIPVKMELRCKSASVKINTDKVSLNVARNRGSFSIAHSYPRLRIDTYDARCSMNLKGITDLVREFGEKGMKTAREVAARYTREGNMLMDISGNRNAISDIVFQRIQDNISSTLGFIPSVPAAIAWSPPQLEMQYEMDRLSFDWHTNTGPEFEYTPAEIEVIIKEYPRIEVEYKGKPVYIPPDADPDYDPEKEEHYLDVTA